MDIVKTKKVTDLETVESIKDSDLLPVHDGEKLKSAPGSAFNIHKHNNKETLDNLSTDENGSLFFGKDRISGVAIDDETESEFNTWSSKRISEEFNKFTPKGQPIGPVTNLEAIGRDSKIIITWTDPEDVDFPDTGTKIKWGGTKLVYKQGSFPTSAADGLIVLDSKVRNAYKEDGFVINGLINGMDYYIGLFSYTEEGVVTSEASCCAKVTPTKMELYRMRLTGDSDPTKAISYMDSTASMIPAKMNYTTGEFDYGSWEDAWFIKNLKPCMLKYDGTVDYELDKNNYALKTDGTPSDISNDAYEGNVMIGIPKIYTRVTYDFDGAKKYDVWFSNIDIKKEDNVICNDRLLYGNFYCWSHLDNNGDEIDYCYTPAYNGYVDSNNKLRSLSGKLPTKGLNPKTEIECALRNNKDDDNIWYTEVYCDRLLINMLLMLIGRSTDTQTTFGYGCSKYSTDASNTYPAMYTGSMDKKGLFWGYQADSYYGIKVFGIENYWGRLDRRTAGLMTVSYSEYNNSVINMRYDVYAKLTYSTKDGSTCTGYHIRGYDPTDKTKQYKSRLCCYTLSSSNYIDEFGGGYGLLWPTGASNGSATTYYCDYGYIYSTTSTVSSSYGSAYYTFSGYPIFGGVNNGSTRMGAFAVRCATAYDSSYNGGGRDNVYYADGKYSGGANCISYADYIGCSISCKPYAPKATEVSA